MLAASRPLRARHPGEQRRQPLGGAHDPGEVDGGVVWRPASIAAILPASRRVRPNGTGASRPGIERRRRAGRASSRRTLPRAPTPGWRPTSRPRREPGRCAPGARRRGGCAGAAPRRRTGRANRRPSPRRPRSPRPSRRASRRRSPPRTPRRWRRGSGRSRSAVPIVTRTPPVNARVTTPWRSSSSRERAGGGAGGKPPEVRLAVGHSEAATAQLLRDAARARP